jgi:hypothetical protein
VEDWEVGESEFGEAVTKILSKTIDRTESTSMRRACKDCEAVISIAYSLLFKKRGAK